MTCSDTDTDTDLHRKNLCAEYVNSRKCVAMANNQTKPGVSDDGYMLST